MGADTGDPKVDNYRERFGSMTYDQMCDHAAEFGLINNNNDLPYYLGRHFNNPPNRSEAMQLILHEANKGLQIEKDMMPKIPKIGFDNWFREKVTLDNYRQYPSKSIGEDAEYNIDFQISRFKQALHQSGALSIEDFKKAEYGLHQMVQINRLSRLASLHFTNAIDEGVDVTTEILDYAYKAKLETPVLDRVLQLFPRIKEFKRDRLRTETVEMYMKRHGIHSMHKELISRLSLFEPLPNGH